MKPIKNVPVIQSKFECMKCGFTGILREFRWKLVNGLTKPTLMERLRGEKMDARLDLERNWLHRCPKCYSELIKIVQENKVN